MRVKIYQINPDRDINRVRNERLSNLERCQGTPDIHASIYDEVFSAEIDFTDLEQLSIGDVFYLHILDETLAYQVIEINVVLPHDTSLLGITNGADYCTLVTCTPFGVNTHRLLVRGTRIPYEEAEEILEQQPVIEEPTSTWEEKYMDGIITGFCIVLILAILAGVVWYIRRK